MIVDWINRCLAMIAAIPVVLLCYDKNALTDNPKGMFVAAVLFAGPLVLLAVSPKSWLSVRISFLTSYAICLCISVRMLAYQGIFPHPDPDFPKLSRWILLAGFTLLASNVALLVQRRRDFNPLIGMCGLIVGFAYPVGAFFASAISANL